MRVDVYFNLHKKLWSVRDRSTGRVVLHATRVDLEDVTFHVSPTGNAKVRREKRKNVHAYVRGQLKNWDSGTITVAGADTGVDAYHQAPRQVIVKVGNPTVSYNPYKQLTFQHLDQPIFETDAVSMFNQKVYLGR